MRFVYPNGLRKALTFSYDDGQSFDRRLAELLRSHGMKGTFHLNSERVGADWGNEKFITAEELKEVYAGHENRLPWRTAQKSDYDYQTADGAGNPGGQKGTGKADRASGAGNVLRIWQLQ